MGREGEQYLLDMYRALFLGGKRALRRQLGGGQKEYEQAMCG